MPLMTMRIRQSIATLLIAVLTLTGHSMAIARGIPAAAGFMELCTGTSPVMVPVDANGQPTGPAHICPEFSLSLGEVVAADLNWNGVSGAVSKLQRDRSQPLITHAILPAESARGPPLDFV